ncbi:hypothetical protein [Streptomyces phaeoluteigriseus]|uniref:hypothetical protein n=1 Tax=Streptomyces phaeoluteigriseus TaxID=114686 RepID=UPI0036B1305D
MRGDGHRGRVVDAGAGAGFGADGLLAFLQCLADQGAVVTLEAGPSAVPLWRLRVLGRDAEAVRASAGECVRTVLPALTGTGADGTMYVIPSDVARSAGIEGTGVLLLDWLVEQGARVFLKADGDRPRPGWTLLVREGPLPTRLRADGPTGGRCLAALVTALRSHGVVVPV